MRPVVGVDLSLTSTGVARLPDQAIRVRTKPEDFPTEDERIEWIVERVLDVIVPDHVSDPLVVIEGLSMGGTVTGSAFTRAGLHYLLRANLAGLGMRFIIVPPSTLKKFATGKGNASKGSMVSAVSRRIGREISSDDTADALALLAFGCELLGQPGPLGVLPKAQRDVVEPYRAKLAGDEVTS